VFHLHVRLQASDVEFHLPTPTVQIGQVLDAIRRLIEKRCDKNNPAGTKAFAIDLIATGLFDVAFLAEV
jgi:hypothetical protein